LVFSFTMGQALAHEHEAHADEQAQLKGIVKNLLKDNNAFVKSHKGSYFKPFTDSQHPRATVVTCSDSRVHTQALDKTPDGDLFMVRDIGNQISTAEGSVEYGVHHLHTPLLIVVGHAACGAIKAASGDYAKESETIKRELDSIKIAKGGDWMEGVKTNVNNQIEYAMKKFAEEIKEGKLTVVGAVYDFRNDLKQGQGRLVITNINGESDAAKVKANPLLSMK
jgi:carbonic anhydrase